MLLTVNVYPLSGRFEKNINAIVAHILKSQTDRSYVPTYSSISLALSQTLWVLIVAVASKCWHATCRYHHLGYSSFVENFSLRHDPCRAAATGHSYCFIGAYRQRVYVTDEPIVHLIWPFRPHMILVRVMVSAVRETGEISLCCCYACLR